MSYETAIMVGRFLKCKCSKVSVPIYNTVCSDDATHVILRDSQVFCSVCGRPTKAAAVSQSVGVDFWSSTGDEDTTEKVRLRSYFTQVQTEFVDGGVGYDYLYVYMKVVPSERTVEVVGESELAKLLSPIDPEMIKLLQLVVGYESIEQHFGILVDIS